MHALRSGPSRAQAAWRGFNRVQRGQERSLARSVSMPAGSSVMCNGVWDLYHSGHCNAWLQARRGIDLLAAGASVREDEEPVTR